MKGQLQVLEGEMAVKILCEIQSVIKLDCTKMHEGDCALYFKRFVKMFGLPLAKFVIDNKVRLQRIYFLKYKEVAQCQFTQ